MLGTVISRLRWLAFLTLLACTPQGGGTTTPTPEATITIRARITALSGDVKVKLASAAEYASAGQDLALTENDKVLTGRDGHATITFENGQIVLLTPDSLVAIQTAEAPANLAAQNRTMDGISVESGNVEVEIDPSTTGSLFRIKTPDAEGIVPMREMEVVGGG